MADVEEWLNRVMRKIEKQRRLAFETPTGTNEKSHPPDPQPHEEIVAQSKEKQPTPKKRKESLKEEVEECKYFQTSFGDHIEIEFR